MTKRREGAARRGRRQGGSTATSRIHDVTLTFSAALPLWPGDPEPRVERIRAIAAGDPCNVTRLEGSVHVGTHVDAPLHFIDHAGNVAGLDLDVLIGPARLVHLPGADAITAEMLDGLALPAGTTRLLLRTRNFELWNEPVHDFRPDFVALTPEAARWVVDRGIRLIGIDSLSVERLSEPGHATHQILLQAEVVIVEGLDLGGVAPGRYRLLCLPMKIGGADGAPARVVLEAA